MLVIKIQTAYIFICTDTTLSMQNLGHVESLFLSLKVDKEYVLVSWVILQLEP